MDFYEKITKEIEGKVNVAEFEIIPKTLYDKIYAFLKEKGGYVFNFGSYSNYVGVETVKTESGITVLMKEEYVNSKVVCSINEAYKDKIKAEMLAMEKIKAETPTKRQQYLHFSPEEFRDLEKLDGGSVEEDEKPVNKHKTGQTSHLRLWSDKGQEYLNVSPEEYRELERLANVEKEKAFQEAVDEQWYRKRYVD